MKIELLANVEANLSNVAGKQLPFAASLALNRTTIGARDLVRTNLPKRFTLRNTWTQRGIQAKTSTKNHLVSQVLAPGYMGIQETGGDRNAEGGHTLSAPGESLKNNRVIPKGKRPRAVLADRAFIIGMPDGDAGVFIRYGKRKGQIRLLWWLADKQHYDDRMMFERDVADYAQDRFPAEFLKAWDEALQSGGYATSAGRGRKRNDRPEGMSARAYRRAKSRGQL